MDSFNLFSFLLYKKYSNKKKLRISKNASIFLGGKFRLLNGMKSIRLFYN